MDMDEFQDWEELQPRPVDDDDRHLKTGAKICKEDCDLPLFTLETVVSATNNFSSDNCIGEGAFGPVYKQLKKSRDPRWDEEFSFMLEKPPVDDKLHIQVVSTSKRISSMHPKQGKPMVSYTESYNFIALLFLVRWHQ